MVNNKVRRFFPVCLRNQWHSSDGHKHCSLREYSPCSRAPVTLRTWIASPLIQVPCHLLNEYRLGIGDVGGLMQVDGQVEPTPEYLLAS